MQPTSKSAVNVPAFLNKLWKIVNDPSTDHLISWGPAGTSFIIQNQAHFWYDLLPLYYKHNNMSSFVRQLNMYGFHKVSTMENGTMDSEKDEIQFHHPFFQKQHPELLKNIKRKVTNNKITCMQKNQPGVIWSEDLTKVLTDVKTLRGRQASVDSQLASMKQENAVLWRELAMLRQKHIKQQQIVNKLIQFLVTIVQPSTRMTGLGVKRPYPLMLNESPQLKKKPKGSESIPCGPTIHELDTSDIVPDELLSDDLEATPDLVVSALDVNAKIRKVRSPVCSTKSSSSVKASQDILMQDSSELADKQVDSLLVDDLLVANTIPEENSSESLQHSDADTPDYESMDMLSNPSVFLNPSYQDTLLSDLICGCYNANAKVGTAKKESDKFEQSNVSILKKGKDDKMTVATRDAKVGYARLSSCEDLELHVENSQNELDQLKDLLNGCSSFDANALLGKTTSSPLKLFSDDSLPYELAFNQNILDAPRTDPLVSGSELTKYGSGMMDFSELFDDSSDNIEERAELARTMTAQPDDTINTPQVENGEPIFPLSHFDVDK